MRTPVPMQAEVAPPRFDMRRNCAPPGYRAHFRSCIKVTSVRLRISSTTNPPRLARPASWTLKVVFPLPPHKASWLCRWDVLSSPHPVPSGRPFDQPTSTLSRAAANTPAAFVRRPCLMLQVTHTAALLTHIFEDRFSAVSRSSLGVRKENLGSVSRLP